MLVRSWDRIVHAAARIGYATPIAQPDRYGVDLVRNVPYRDSGKRAHLLDVYRPRSSGPSPAVMYVHGGGFAVLSKDTHRVMALMLASRGYTVFNINYRMGAKHRYPAPIEDASAALEWVLDNGRDFGADLDRLALAGESAGANLVTALGIACTSKRPELFARRLYDRNIDLRAILPIYGLHDMHDLQRFNHPRLPRTLKIAIREAAAAYVGRPVRAQAPKFPLASPLRVLSGEPAPTDRPLPPFFLACGTRDPLLVDSKRLRNVLMQRGVECELSIHPGEIHGFNAMFWRPEARAKWSATFDFLSRHVARPERSAAAE